VVRGRKLPAQRELQREVDQLHNELAAQHAEQAGLQVLRAALALGAPVELVIRTDRTEHVERVSFHRRNDNRFVLDRDGFTVDGLVGSVRETVIRLHEGSPEVRVDNPLGCMGALFDGDEVVFGNIDIEVNDGTNT